MAARASPNGASAGVTLGHVMYEALAIPADPTSDHGVLDRLRDALAGRGPLLLPHGPEEPAPQLPTSDSRTGESGGDDPHFRGSSDRFSGGVAVGTSGSTGASKRAVLSPEALTASADATHARLGGPGRWLSALPPHHIAGLQIVLRSLRAGHVPAVMPPGAFRPDVFAEAVRGMTGGRRYSSLVPTQLRRVLADATATAAAGELDAVLVGGSAVDAGLLDQAREAGLRIVVTYGMSETAGGCVYDGVPLDGVEVRLVDGRVHLAGPMLADGYLAPPPDDPFVTLDETRFFRTDDLGHLDGERLVIDGRADDVVISGGLKVWPREVESVLTALVPASCEVLAVGVPDAEWGQRIVVAVEDPTGTLDAAEFLTRAREVLSRQARPRDVRVVTALPRRGPGKPDRAAVARLFTGASC